MLCWPCRNGASHFTALVGALATFGLMHVFQVTGISSYARSIRLHQFLPTRPTKSEQTPYQEPPSTSSYGPRTNTSLGGRHFHTIYT